VKKSLIAAMRLFHYMVGITAPPKEREMLVLFVWIATAIALAALGLLFAWFIVPHVLR
jgi:hypothetical protein